MSSRNAGLAALACVVATAALGCSNHRAPTFAPTNPAETLVKTANLSRPSSLAVDSNSNLYVLDTADDPAVFRFSPDGSQHRLAFTKLNNPQRISIDSTDNIYVTDTGNNRVLRLSAATGEIDTLPAAPPAPENINGRAAPSDVHADGSANLFLLDAGSTSPQNGSRCRLSVLRSGESAWRPITELPQCSASNFVVDGDDVIYLADDKGVTRVASDGATHRLLPVAFNASVGWPTAITSDKNGRLYIAPAGGDTVYLYDRGGAQSSLKLTHLHPDSRSIMNAVIVDAGMNVYVAEPLQGFVVRVAAVSS